MNHFFCRVNGSELKLCPKVAEIYFSYFAKIPQWLEMVGGRGGGESASLQRVNFCNFHRFA